MQKKYVISLALVAALFAACFFAGISLAVDDDSQHIQSKYKEVLKRLEECESRGHNVLRIREEMTIANNALVSSNLPKAGRSLERIRKQLDMLEANIPQKIENEKKTNIVLIYADVIQQLAFILFISFLFVSIKRFHRIIYRKETATREIVLFFVFFLIASLLACLLQIFKFGTASLVFMDAQLILNFIAGIFGGPVAGFACGAVNSLLRFVIVEEQWMLSFLPLAAGIIGAILYLTSAEDSKISLFNGVVGGSTLGILQGFLIYIPLGRNISSFYFGVSLCSLIILESVAAVLFLFVVRHFLELERSRETAELFLRMKLKFLQVQISPHFLFNVLNTIANAWGEHAEVGRDLIVKLSTYLRNILGREDIFISLKDEISTIKTYLEIEQVRFEKRLSINIIERITAESLNKKIPILIMQPVVENALKHGFRNKSVDARLIITIDETEKDIIITVADNGCGMSGKKLDMLLNPRFRFKDTDSEGLGIGVLNVHERLIMLYGENYGLKYESKEGVGTSVRIDIPKK